MREKLSTLPVVQLREIAKQNGIKSVTTLRKQQLIDMIIEVSERKAKAQVTEKPEKKTTENQEAKPETLNRDENKTDLKRNGSTKSARRENDAESSDKKSVRAREIENGERKSVRANGPEMGERRGKRTGEHEAGERKIRKNRESENGEKKTRRTVVNEGFSKENLKKENIKKEYVVKKNGAKAEENPEMTDTITNIPAEQQGDIKTGILEVMPDGFGFIRCDNYLPGEDDVYVAPSQIKRFNLKTGDILEGRVRAKRETEKFGALYYLDKVNDEPLDKVLNRKNFEDLTPIFPNKRLHLERTGGSMAMRIVDLISPIGKGQRGMIVSPPKAGKTTLLKEVAKSIQLNNPEMKMIILLIDERPEEVTDIKEAIEGENVEVIYSTFDELPEHHKRVSEMVIERAKRLVEHGHDVIILLDSITRLARAYNMTVPPSGRTLSGGLDPAALHMPKRFFGAARNMREGGSLTVLATALVDTGSKMDDVVYEEFKGTGNMELVLDRKLSEKRVFPAIDIIKSGTRREDLLLDKDELGASFVIRKETNGMKKEDAVEQILNLFYRTKSNKEFVSKVSSIRSNGSHGNAGRTF